MASDLITKCLILLLMPFLHEDVAIVAAAYFVREHALPLAVTLAVLYVGVLFSDVFIYGLGVAARRIAPLRACLINERVQRGRDRLTSNLLLAIALCRLVPGVLFPTFVACGWLGVSFWRFIATTAVACAVYVAVVFALVLSLGSAILGHVGSWAWVIMLALILALGARRGLRPALRFLVRPFTGRGHRPRRQGSTDGIDLRLPAVQCLPGAVGLAERIPQGLFYAPLAARWILLGLRYRCFTLPALANPHLEMGGLWGESKSRCMNQLRPSQRNWLAPFATIRCSGNGQDLAVALQAMDRAGLRFPLVVKPDVGWQGYGVRLLEGPAQLADYIDRFPADETIILQRHAPYDGEAGVFYVRRPGQQAGCVTSLTFRYFPHVVGDGVSTLAQLIERDPRTRFKSRFILGRHELHRGITNGKLHTVPARGETLRLSFIGSIRVGGLYRDARRHITPALTRRFDEIAHALPEFHLGRFDIRFRSIEALEAGEDFVIIEINGAGSEAIHMWDPGTGVRDAYRELFRYQHLLFEIGHQNRARGFRPMSVREFYRFTSRQNRLVQQYPPSD